MADKITWNDKVSLVTDPTIAEINKVTDDNMNEIKSVTNTNADQLDETIVYDENDITTNTKALIKQGNYRYINSEIDNEYGTATNKGYSQEYINNIHLTELLGSTGLTQGSSYQLSDNITNYKYIMIVLSTGGMFQNATRQYIPVSQIADYTTDYRCALSLFQSTTVFVFADFYFDAVNSIKCNGYTKGTTGWNGAIRVYGIK